MANIIVVFPKQEDAKAIRNLLVRNGFQVIAVCTTGAQALTSIEELNDGIGCLRIIGTLICVMQSLTGISRRAFRCFW